MEFTDVMSQIFTTTVASVNVSLVIILLAVGYICKHAFKSLKNDIIPIILGVIALVFLVIVNWPFSVQDKLLPIIIEAIATTLIATISHDKVKDIVGGLTGTTSTKQEVVQEQVADEAAEQDSTDEKTEE